MRAMSKAVREKVFQVSRKAMTKKGIRYEEMVKES